MVDLKYISYTPTNTTQSQSPPELFRKYIQEKRKEYMGQCIQEWAKWNLWKTAFKKFYFVHSCIKPLKNFTWSTLEYFVHI